MNFSGSPPEETQKQENKTCTTKPNREKKSEDNRQK